MSVVLVTGASRGLGRFLCDYLRTAGHRVFGASRSLVSDDPDHLPLDVTRPSSCEECCSEVVSRAGRLDVLVNNAGMHLLGAAVETTREELDDQMALNFFGAVNMIRSALPHLLERGGRIVNVSSVGGRLATPFASAYCASKFALEGYTESLRLEVLHRGVFVSNLEPGFIATGTTDTSIVQVERAHPDYAHPRRVAYDRMLSDGKNGIPPELVGRAVTRIMSAKRPRLRYSVDGFLTRLEMMRAVLPASMFEAAVLRTTSPELAALGKP
jgi:NAD(P)-dependent dehydrogenase (short-subunit alcohol dehydrogenase family)